MVKITNGSIFNRQDIDVFVVNTSKNRKKTYTTSFEKPTLYMDNNEEFGFEIFNPTEDVIAASFEFNNKLISSSKLVINPGQRVFLERYFDTNDKFKYSIYEIDTEVSKEIKESIINNNGNIKISFYKKIIPYNTFTYKSNFNDFNINEPYISPFKYTTFVGNSTFNYCSSNTNTVTCNLSTNINETGIIDKGSKSNQEFNSVNDTFDIYSFKQFEFKMVPLSYKDFISKDEIREYCTECGKRRRKDSWKFCPDCGTKY